MGDSRRLAVWSSAGAEEKVRAVATDVAARLGWHFRLPQSLRRFRLPSSAADNRSLSTGSLGWATLGSAWQSVAERCNPLQVVAGGCFELYSNYCLRIQAVTASLTARTTL